MITCYSLKILKKLRYLWANLFGVLLGIKPIKASTGLGYIKSIGKSYIKIEQFIEKPPKKISAKY